MKGVYILEPNIIIRNSELEIFDKHFIVHFLELKSRKSKYTSMSYLRDIKDFFKVKHIQEITLEDIIRVHIFDVEKYIMDMEDKGLKSSTINRKISSLSSLYKWLQKYQDNSNDFTLIKYNPFANLKEAKPSVVNDDTEFLTKEEAKKLLDSISMDNVLGIRNKAILSLALTTALRKSELINIKIGDIKTLHGHTVVHVVRKGKKKDIVKVQPQVEQLILKYIDITNRNSQIDGSDYLFKGHSTNKRNNNKLNPSTLNYMIKKCCENAGIEKKLKVHSTRHTAITLAITSGATIEKVRDFAAHKNITTTNRYVHSINKLEENAGDLIDIL